MGMTYIYSVLVQGQLAMVLQLVNALQHSLSSYNTVVPMMSQGARMLRLYTTAPV